MNSVICKGYVVGCFMGDFNMFIDVSKYCCMFFDDIFCVNGCEVDGVWDVFVSVVFMIVDCVVFEIFV